MKEIEEWTKDYQDCINYLNDIDRRNDYAELSIWSLNKYDHWIKKNEENRFFISRRNYIAKRHKGTSF